MDICTHLKCLSTITIYLSFFVYSQSQEDPTVLIRGNMNIMHVAGLSCFLLIA